jgi:AbrB family looped-hinge helix DNA binding protein
MADEEVVIKGKNVIVGIASVGSQHRTYIPKSLRDALGVAEGDRLIFLRIGDIQPRQGDVVVRKLTDELKSLKRR